MFQLYMSHRLGDMFRKIQSYDVEEEDNDDDDDDYEQT